MESRFARLMLYKEIQTSENKHQVKAESHVPADANFNLTRAIILSRAKMEQLTGKELVRVEEQGNLIDIEFKDDSELPEEVVEDIRTLGEKVSLYENVRKNLISGNLIFLGKDEDPRVKFENQTRIMITKDSPKSEMVYTRIILQPQAKELVEDLFFTRKLDQKAERQEFAWEIATHLERGHLVLLKPARKLN